MLSSSNRSVTTTACTLTRNSRTTSSCAYMSVGSENPTTSESPFSSSTMARKRREDVVKCCFFERSGNSDLVISGRWQLMGLGVVQILQAVFKLAQKYIALR